MNDQSRPFDRPIGKILFVSHEASRTGAPMFLLHLLRWLKANTELRFELLLGKDGPLKSEFAKVAPIRIEKDFEEDPDLISSFDLLYSNTACNGLLLERIGCRSVPVITHVHELDMGYNWLGARAMAAVIRQSSRYFGCANVVSTSLQRAFGVTSGDVSVHYEMIDPDMVAHGRSGESAQSLRQRYDLPDDALIVAGCGTFDLRKGPDLFVQVAARVKSRMGVSRPLRFLWIGAQNATDLLAAVSHDVRKLGLDTEVKFISELPSPHGLIALSDVFCLTSREDPFPLVMLESALLEKPVLSFAGSGGAEEFCQYGGGLAVPYLDAAAMGDMVCELFKDLNRAREVGRRAADVVRQRFTVEAVAPALWSELKGCLVSGLGVPPARNPSVSLASILRAWSPDRAPEPVYVRASLARDRSRGEARRLFAMGRRKEAAQILVSAVSADLATKRPNIICDGLIELAAEMERVDPRQAAAMVDQARQLALRSGLRIAAPAQRRETESAAA